MKIRTSLVSNSSSTSYVFIKKADKNMCYTELDDLLYELEKVRSGSMTDVGKPIVIPGAKIGVDANICVLPIEIDYSDSERILDIMENNKWEVLDYLP